METLLNPITKLPIFDVQVDGNHLYEEGTTQVCVYTVHTDHLGFTATDTLQSVVSIEVPSLGYADDVWVQSDNIDGHYASWPEHIRRAYDYAVQVATDLYFSEHDGDPRFKVGETVFLIEHRMPANIIAITGDNRYVVDMGDSGVFDLFSAMDFEPYDRDRWHRA